MIKNRYQISPLAGVRKEYTIDEDGNVYGIFGKQLKPKLKDKHLSLMLKRNDTKQQKYMFVHRLVALTFIPIPSYLKEIPISKLHVHHIDRNPLNNNKNNLIWLSEDEHMLLHTRMGDFSINPKPCVQLKGNKIVGIYYSESDAAKATGIPIQNISEVIKGTVHYRKNGKPKRRLSAGGYGWTNKLEGQYILSLQ